MNYAEIAALNWSSLVSIDTSPLLYRHRAAHPREDTPPMKLGRAVHCRVLEPAEYADRYVVAPAGLDRRTKAGKAEWEALNASGLEVLTDAEGDAVEEIAEAVVRHPRARELLDGAAREVTVEWEVDGVACKGRVDALAPDRLIDLKTTRTPLAQYDREAGQRRVHGQLAWYAHGAREAGLLAPSRSTTRRSSRYAARWPSAWSARRRKPEAGLLAPSGDVYLIVVESTPPHDCGVLRLPAPVLEEGERLWRRLLDDWRACTATGRWPGAIPRERDLVLPRYAWTESAPEEW